MRIIALSLGLICLMAYQIIYFIKFVRTMAAGNGVKGSYGFLYSTVFAGIVLLFLRPIVNAMVHWRVPLLAVFLAFGGLFCFIEEGFCYVTKTGIWDAPKPFYPECILGIGFLVWWVVGVYLVVRYLQLAKYEIFVFTGLAGWFLELVVTRPQYLLSHPFQGLFGIPWVTWCYAILVLIPVSVAYRHEMPLAKTGRWWRRLLAFAVPIAVAIAGTAPLALAVHLLTRDK